MKQISISEVTNEKLQEINDNLIDLIQDEDVKLEIYQGMTHSTKFIMIELNHVEKCSVSMTEDDTMIEIATSDYMFLVTLKPEDFVNIVMR